MKLIVLIILLATNLTHLPLKPPLDTALKQQLVRSASETTLSAPVAHRNLAEPVKLNSAALHLGTQAAYAVDLDTATPLFKQNESEPRPIASIAKLATAMVILDSHSLDEIVTVPALPAYQAEDAQLGLKAGQRFKLRDLLAAALIPSANDAADALALSDSPTTAAFAAKMNRLSQHWGVKDTRFTNPSGLGAAENLASAEALVKLAKIALSNPILAQIVSTPAATISDLTGHSYNLTSTNKLLDGNRIIGLKTGYTPAAGQCLITLANIKGHRVITVVLNSPDRFGETTQLVNWIEQNWEWK